jgi:hypothetical protein
VQASPVQEPLTQVITQVVQQPAGAGAGTADVQPELRPSSDPTAFVDRFATSAVAPGASSGGSPQATPRPDSRLGFSSKNGMHIYYPTPLEAGAAERARVQGSMSSLTAYIAERNAAAGLMNAAGDCQASPDDGNLRDRLCTHKTPFDAGHRPAGPAPAPRDDAPKPPPAQPKTSYAEDYWQRSLDDAAPKLDKANTELQRAEFDARDARRELEQATAEVIRLTKLLQNWDPKKADPKIEGRTHVIEREPGPAGEVKYGTKEHSSYSRLKTKSETRADLEKAKKDRAAAEAKKNGTEARERVMRERRDAAARAKTWAETKLDQAKAGDPAGNPPGPTGPVMAR